GEGPGSWGDMGVSWGSGRLRRDEAKTGWTTRWSCRRDFRGEAATVRAGGGSEDRSSDPGPVARKSGAGDSATAAAQKPALFVLAAGHCPTDNAVLNRIPRSGLSLSPGHGPIGTSVMTTQPAGEAEPGSSPDPAPAPVRLPLTRPWPRGLSVSV